MNKITFPPPFLNYVSNSPSYFSLQRSMYDKAIENLCIAEYQERADVCSNILRYNNSDEYLNSARMIEKLSELPELSFCDVEKMLEDEKKDQETIQFLVDHENLSTLKSEELSFIYTALGLSPEKNKRTLNNWLINFDSLTDQEIKKIEDAKNNKSGPIGGLVDIFRTGLLVDYGDGTNFIDLIRQGRQRYYYRGENAFYGSSKANYFRNFVGKTDKDRMKIIISQLQLFSFIRFLEKFDICKKWSYGQIFPYAIAQHYGFPTNLMDVTSNLDVALFFACCKYDNYTKKWLPLERTDFEKVDSRKNVANIGGDSRYAVIHRALSEIVDWAYYVENKGIKLTKVMPIGYQPFMRCNYQYGYLIRTNSEYDMYKDQTFEKFKIPLSEKLCKMVYEKMEQGEKIYPNDGLSECEDIIESIKKSKSFYLCDLEPTAKEFWPNAPTPYVRDRLEDNGCSFHEYEKELSPRRIKRIAKLNKKWRGFNFEKHYGFSVKMRPMITIGGDTLVEENMDGTYSIINKGVHVLPVLGSD